MIASSTETIRAIPTGRDVAESGARNRARIAKPRLFSHPSKYRFANPGNGTVLAFTAGPAARTARGCAKADARMSRDRAAPALSGLVADVSRFPRVRLAHSPTPMEAAPNLGGVLGVELWIKRDDCTGLAMGGNKLRQLEFHFGQAQARGADTVLVTGAVQSNLARLAAAGARRLGMGIHIQLEERVNGAGDLYRASGNVLLDRLMGVTLHSFPSGEDEAGADVALERIAGALRADGKRPYVIHSGVEQPPLGGLGYVIAAGEVAGQAAARRLAFDAIVCPSGSGLTQAGMLAGLRAAGETAPIYGICVRRAASRQQARVEGLVAELAAMIGRPRLAAEADVQVCDAVHPPGYGRLNGAVREAVSMAARLEGLLLDPVYSGKAMAGLIAHVRSGRIRLGSRVLFLHTGGLPAIFAYADELGTVSSKRPEIKG